jgi:Flp pilus assembly protein TadD
VKNRSLDRRDEAMRKQIQMAIVGLMVWPCLYSAASPATAQTCTPPDTMKSHLLGEPDAAAFTDLGVWFAEQKNYACAANAFASSLQKDPNQKDVGHIAFMFGVSLYYSNDAKEAIPALQEAEKLGYRDIKIHLILAEALDASHATADAEAEWRAALEVDPEYTSALDNLSADLLVDGNFKGVIDLLDTPRLQPQRTPQQCLNLAAAYAKSGKVEDAARVLRDGLNTAPDSVLLAEALADTLNQLGRRDEATAVVEVVHARQVNNPKSAAH